MHNQMNLHATVQHISAIKIENDFSDIKVELNLDNDGLDLDDRRPKLDFILPI